MRVDVSLLLTITALAVPSAALAQRAEYARPDELRGEGLSHLLDVSLRLGYARTVEAGGVPALVNAGSFSLRNRALLGRRVAFCAGLDGEIGGSDAGVVYGLTGYLLGVGARWGAGNAVALCGGAGFSGVTDAVPFAGRFPVELSVAQSVGPLRVLLWAGVAWTAGDALRREGSRTLSFVDEAEAGLSVRFGRQRRYWSSTNAGSGPSLGVVYKEFMGARQVGVVIGLDLSGAR